MVFSLRGLPGQTRRAVLTIIWEAEGPTACLSGSHRQRKIEQFAERKSRRNSAIKLQPAIHIRHYTDLMCLQNDYPEWQITTSLDQIFEEFVVDFAAGAAAAA